MSLLDDASKEIADDVRQVEGVRSVPQYATDSALLFPFVAVFPGVGRLTQSPAGLSTGIHAIILEVHLARVDLPSAIKAAIPFGDTIPDAIFSGLNRDKFNGKVSTIQEIRYTFGPLDWGGTKTLGFKFELDVKLQQAISTT